MEDVNTTEGKNTPITNFSTMKTTSLKLPTISITSRISKFGQHLHLIHAPHTYSDPNSEERTFNQWHVISRKMH